MGTLYDATKCIGCKKCQNACQSRRESLYPGDEAKNRTTSPNDLSADNWTIIKLYQDEEYKSVYSFVKNQCMHCVDPACATACPVKALEKTKAGPVIYHSEICIGCRYCMAACPFDIPKYQWDKVFPLIQKCDFCADRQAAGLLPACAEACTNGALIYGKRSELIKVARERIKTNPETYVNHIYGEYEVGGTSNLYISNVAFDKLGFPNLNTTALPELTWPWMSAVPGVFVGMAGLMTGIYFITKRKGENNKEEK
jgi:formate dehydrogenase iron-sulfur subunit